MPDLLSREFYADLDSMHDTFRSLRAEGPVFRDEVSGMWGVLGHPELIDVEARDEVFCSGRGFRAWFAPGEQDMIAIDDPQHAAQRRLVSRRFTPKAVQQFAPVIEAMVDELIDGFVARGSFEVVGELAAPLPARLTAHLIGFPDEHALSLRTWSERLMRIDSIQTDGEALMGFMGAINEFSSVLIPLIESARAGDGSDNLIGVWSGAELDGCPMAAEIIMQETGLFISGGAETTRTVIARGLLAFAEHRDQWEAMAADPSLVPDAVEELIRWVTPLNNFFRTATRDTSIGEVAVAEGDRIVLLYPSANRDERVFADPYRFDIRRHPNPHVSFGFGTHFCLGASLARLELRILFERLASRVRDLEVLDGPDIEPNIFVGAVRSCEMGFHAR
jgi:cytochrome P450 family 142 subfamily A polypeptide 1